MDSAQIMEAVTSGMAFLEQHFQNYSVQLVGTAAHMPSEAQDVDLCVLLDSAGPFHNIDETFDEFLRGNGFTLCAGEYDVDSTWAAYRSGDLNIMFTFSSSFYNGFTIATNLNKALNITSKRDRIIVCRIVRDGETAEEAVKSADEWMTRKGN